MRTNFIYIVRNVKEGTDPSQINVENSFLTLQEDFEAVAATSADIKEYGWGELEVNA